MPSMRAPDDCLYVQYRSRNGPECHAENCRLSIDFASFMRLKLIAHPEQPDVGIVIIAGAQAMPYAARYPMRCDGIAQAHRDQGLHARWGLGIGQVVVLADDEGAGTGGHGEALREMLFEP